MYAILYTKSVNLGVPHIFFTKFQENVLLDFSTWQKHFKNQLQILEKVIKSLSKHVMWLISNNL